MFLAKRSWSLVSLSETDSDSLLHMPCEQWNQHVARGSNHCVIWSTSSAVGDAECIYIVNDMKGSELRSTWDDVIPEMACYFRDESKPQPIHWMAPQSRSRLSCSANLTLCKYGRIGFHSVHVENGTNTIWSQDCNTRGWYQSLIRKQVVA